MNTFRPDAVTEPRITNAKGVEFKLGDLVTAGSSKVVRQVHGIFGSQVRGVRIDGSIVASSAWMSPDKLRLVTA